MRRILIRLTPQADLAISKTDGATEAVPGNSISYTIVVTNSGPSSVTGATVGDTMPASLSSVTWTCSASSGSSCSASGSGNISDAAVNLLASGTATYTVTGTVSASATGSLSNTASVSVPSGTTDPTPGNNSATDTDTLTPQADLAITKTDGVTEAVPGNGITYTITVTNNGPSNVTGATVSDTMPASLSSVTWTCSASLGSSCTGSGSGNISDTAVNLLASGTATYTVTGTVSASATGSLSNTASVSVPSGTTDPTPGNNSATDTDTLTPRADLAITKTGPGSVNRGETLTFAIKVKNNGPSDATGVIVSDPTPAGLIFQSADFPCNGGFPCTISDIASGDEESFNVSYTVPADYAGPDPIVNTAAVRSDVPDPDPTNNDISSSTAVDREASADLTVVKTGPPSAAKGSTVTYQISVTNNGPDDAANVVLADTISAGLTFVSADVPCTGGFPCTIGTVNAGTTSTINATYSIPIGYAGADPTVNTVTVSSDTGDPVPGNNTSTVNVPIGADTADLSVTKSGPAEIIAGNNITYIIKVSNNGPAMATGITLTDPTPSGLNFVSADAPCGTGFPCNLGSLVSGSSITIQATYNVPGGYAGANPIVNTATVSANEPDANPSNNTDSAATGVGIETADLAVVKTGPATAVPGEKVTFRIVVTNNGPGTATGIQLADTTPSGLTFNSASTPCASGFPCSLGTLVSGSSITVSVTYNIPAGYTSPDPIVNKATVSANEPDADTSNNTSDASVPIDSIADLADNEDGRRNRGGARQRDYIYDSSNEQRAEQCDRGDGKRYDACKLKQRYMDMFGVLGFQLHGFGQREYKRYGGKPVGKRHGDLHG